MFGISGSLMASIAEADRALYESRWRMEAERYEAQRRAVLARLEFDLSVSGASRPALVAATCEFCGRPTKASARRGDGCEGCGAPLALAARGKK